MNPLDFWDKYELINSTKTFIPLATKVNNCRYCGKNQNETTFLQDTHLLPELLGENNLLSYDECDNCNKLFSDYESHLSIFLRPYATLMGRKGKKKVPIFQSRSINRDENTRTILKHIQGSKKQLIIQNIDDYTINKDNKTFDIVFRQPPFVPLKLYKALLKIGLSLLPIQYDCYNIKTFEWITNKIEELPFIPFAFCTAHKNIYFKNTVVDLYRAKIISNESIEHPEYTLILSFANLNIQIFLPFSDELKKNHCKEKQLEMNLFPAFDFDRNDKSQYATIKYYNWGINTPISENHKMSFTYKTLEENQTELL